jgi:threonine/homoserine/homoserine lactone efflux protein
MVSLVFILGLVALLATPGPTNTLLLLGGSGRRSFRASLPLLGAELGAYLVAVLAIGLIAERLLAPFEHARLALQIAAAAYLAWLAYGLWRRGASDARGGHVTPRMVAVTTLGNPKAFIIALPMMPAGAFGDPELLLAHLGVLALIIPLVGGAWVLLGVALSRSPGGRVSARLPRVASLALVLFSLLLMRSAVMG